MAGSTAIAERKLKVYTRNDLERIPQLAGLSPDELLTMKTVSAVLPFRANNYVIEDLIDWDNIPDDPIFQLVFPQRGMLDQDDFEHIRGLLAADAPRAQVLA